MDFMDQIKLFINRVEKLQPQIQIEEATKTSLIMPFFQILGYDVFNPLEFMPEFTADVGIKKGEKVDYAIILDNVPAILIEAKWVGENLDKHGSQLFRYFGTSPAKFAILTNGVEYRFYTDLDEPNKMDGKPFFSFSLLDIKDQELLELKKFQKSTFDLEKVFNTAEDLKYTNQIKLHLSQQIEEPSESFVTYIVGEVYEGKRTKNVLDKFKPVVKKSLSQFINDILNERLKAAMNQSQDIIEPVANMPDTAPAEEPVSRINTTQDELEAFAIIKVLLKNIIPVDKISYKDTESYFAVLYDKNSWKWICRLVVESPTKKSIIIHTENKTSQKYPIDSINDIFKYEDQLIVAAKNFVTEEQP